MEYPLLGSITCHTLTNANYMAMKWTSMKYEPKYKQFDSRQCIVNCIVNVQKIYH